MAYTNPLGTLYPLGSKTELVLWYLAASVLLVAVGSLLRVGRRPSNYPPGPRTFPIVGNLLQLASRDTHKQYQVWASKYGPVFSLMLGTKTMVVLSSDVAVKEVLDKNSAVTNERGDHYIGHKVLGGGEHMLLMPNGPTWRLQRKLMQKMLNINVYRSYIPYTLLENKQMLFDLLQKPDDFIYHIKRYSNSTFLSITYGRRCPSSDDATMRQFVASVDKMATIMQSSSSALPDIYPILRNLPDWMVPARAEAQAWHENQTAFYLGQWNQLKARLQQGVAPPCFVLDLILDQKKEGFTDKFGAFLAGGALEAGTDTTANELVGFVQAMILFPEVQTTAQAELDRAIGADRLPGIDDMPSLPYIRACVKETLRWFPTAVMGAAPHAAREDLTYNGLIIPKGALLINNVYTINNDPARHDDPRVFRPERYAGDNKNSHESAQSADVAQRDHFTFGAGRRLCAGVHVAEQSLFLGIARILWAFTIRHKLDPATGQPIVPNPDLYTQAVVCMPEPFPASITPRSAARAKLVEAQWKEAQATSLDENMQWKVVGQGLKFTHI